MKIVELTKENSEMKYFSKKCILGLRLAELDCSKTVMKAKTGGM